MAKRTVPFASFERTAALSVLANVVVNGRNISFRRNVELGFISLRVVRVRTFGNYRPTTSPIGFYAVRVVDDQHRAFLMF
jgi:hypothetical protein